MIEQTIDIKTRDGGMETFVVRPERNGPFPAVLMLMDAPGIREELYDMARRLATVGYCVLLPNLYYRAGRDTKYGPDVLEHGSADADPHARRPHQDDDPAGHGRRRRHARLSRRAG